MAQYIYGRNAVIHALKNNTVKKLYLASEIKDFNYQEHLQGRKISVEVLSRKQLTQLVHHDKHQGVVASIEEYRFANLATLLNYKEKQYPLVVILDSISDPQNYGAIIRSCDELEVDFIIVKNVNQAPINQVVMKASAGALNYVKIIEVSNLSNTIKTLKENGYWIVGMAGEAKADIYSFDYRSPIALVFGSEGDGIAPLVKKNCDVLLKIPTNGHVGSLNVSVSVGITLANLKHMQNS